MGTRAMQSEWRKPHYAHDGLLVNGSCAVWQSAFGTYHGTTRRMDPRPFARALGPFATLEEATRAVDAVLAAELAEDC